MSKSVRLRNLDKILNNATPDEIVKAVSEFLKSSHHDCVARKDLLKTIQKHSEFTAQRDLRIYTGMSISEHQYRIVKADWTHYIDAVLEIADSYGGTVSNIIAHLDVFLTDIGERHLTGMDSSNSGKSIISSILLLGGFTFKSRRIKETGSTERILTSIKGTELLNLESRQSIARTRCIRMGLIKE